MVLINTIHNLSISKKLLLFAIVPTLTILIFAIGVISNKNTAHERHQITHDFILTSIQLVQVIAEIQKERGYDNAIDHKKITPKLLTNFTNQQDITDKAIINYHHFIQKANSSPKDWKLKKEFQLLDEKLKQLPSIRLKKTDHHFKRYTAVIESALSIIQTLQARTDDSALINKISVYSTLLWLQEYSDQERSLIHGIFIKGKINLLQSHAINSIIQKKKQLIHFFNSIAPKAIRLTINQQLDSSVYKQINALKQGIVNRSERSELLNRLHVFFGYGGMIHSYKNYLLRSNTRDLKAFNFVSKEALNVIKEMRRLKGISISDLNHLNTIQITIYQYIDKMVLMQKLKQDGLTIKQIDPQVAINDFLALTAFAALLEGETNIDANVWQTKTNQQFKAIEVIVNELKTSIRLLSEQDVNNAKRALIYNSTLMTFAILLIIFLASIILKRLVIDIADIAEGMNQMSTTGNYEEKLSVKGKDEIAVMAKSFNALLHKINISQNQLIGQQSAMDEHNIIAMTDLKGTITYVNQKFCDISGFTKEELIGSNHRIFNSGDQSPEYWKKMFLSVSKGHVWHDEVKNITKDGHAYWLDTTILPITWDPNNKGYITIRTDITNRKQQEQHLLEAKIAAEAATVAKSQFLATMSHEIRTPMNGVIGMAQLLEDTPLNDEQKDYLSTITHSGTNLLSIINDILDFSKLDAEMVDIEAISFNLENLCHETIVLIAGNAIEKHLEFIFDYAPDCPRQLTGDPSRIRQILLNFLGNSVKFTKQGFIRLGILALNTNENDVALKIEIQDTGIGLEPEAIKTLFDEFTQADTSTTREFGGTGLGLAITKKIAHLMGAKIEVESSPGEGSTFSILITLPISSEPQSINESSLTDVNILFVDDHQENRHVFKRLLDHMGANTTTVSDPLKTEALALQAIKEKNPYQIIILDHHMPNISGEELGTQIRNNPNLNNTKLLMFSSVGQKGDAALFSKIGFDAYLNKLSRYDTLKAILSAMLEHQKGQPLITQYSVKDAQLKTEEQNNFVGNILLVEDILPNQIIAKKFLVKMGLNVDVANNGKEAIQAVTQKTFDLVFMDCRMPIIDGYEATRLIRQQEAKTLSRLPIIALTANASQEDKELCQQAGMDDIITKPFRRTDLSECLQKWLTTSHNLKQEDQIMPKTSQTEAAILDKAIYQQLQDDMGEDFDTIKEAIIESIQENIIYLEEGNSNTPTSDLIRFAHSIKSPAANLGLMRLSHLAEALETYFKNNQTDSFEQGIAELKNAFDDAKLALV